MRWHVVLLLSVAMFAAAEAAKAKMEGSELTEPEAGLTEADLDELLKPGPEMMWQRGWPRPSVRRLLGQVSGVGVDSLGNSYVFHRADRPWRENDFNSRNEYTHVKQGAIEKATILKISPNGDLLESFGNGSFYLPHGLTVDHEDNIWVTDVARHQIIKFKKGRTEPDLVVGEKFVPGNDRKHFCKPTKVAVAKNGDFFVADGYCNARIMKFDRAGRLKKEWGRDSDDSADDRIPAENEFLIPHGVTLDETNDLVCVADREHRRVQCFRAGLWKESDTGVFESSIQEDDFGRVMDVAFLPGGRYLLVLSLPDGSVDGDVESRGFVYDTKLGSSINFFTFRPENDDSAFTWGFGEGHALGASAKGDNFVVGSLVARCNGPVLTCFGPHPTAVPYSTWRFKVQQNN